MKQFTIEQVSKAIADSWVMREGYSYPSVIDASNPAAGQCAVSSLVLQDYFGGEILRVDVRDPDAPEDDEGSSHYYNVIDGKTYDITKQQFIATAVRSKPEPKTGGYASTRRYMLATGTTRERYEPLKARVEQLLNDLTQA